jgi:hypothetical protein
MRNTTCIICLQEFKPREGKLYCSNACKQKGYSDKKHQTTNTIINEIDLNNIKKKYIIYFPEFQEYQETYPNDIDSFIFYCFFRKNLIGVSDVKQVYDYIDSFEKSWFKDLWENENSSIYKKYKDFESKFLDDDFIISFENQKK